MQDENNIETIHLADYFQVISKRKNLVIAFLLGVVSLTMLFSFLTRPVYQASAVVVIDREQTSSPLDADRGAVGSFQTDMLTFNTHFKLITSKAVIAAVIRELKLDQKGELESDGFRALLSQFQKNIKLLFSAEKKENSADDTMNALMKTLQNSIQIKTTRETRLLTILVENNDAELAAKIANTLARKYIEFNVSNRLEASKETVAWMHNELYETKKKLEDDEQKFMEFKKEQNVFSVEGKQKVIGQKISEFNNEYLGARNKRLELDEKLKELEKYGNKSSDLVHIRSIIGNPAIDSIYATLTSLEVEQSKLSKVFKAKHPKMVQVSSEIEKLRASLHSELLKEISNLKSMRSVLAAREQVMEKNIAEFEGDALDAGGKELHYNILQRNVTTSQSLYDTLLSKIKESNILTSGYTSNIRIVENASPPVAPFKPNKKKNLLLSLLLGLFGGIGLAFFLEYFDRTVKNEDDILAACGLPVLAVIPVADRTDKQGAY